MTKRPKKLVEYNQKIADALEKGETVLWACAPLAQKPPSKIQAYIATLPNWLRVGLRVFLLVLPYVMIVSLYKDFDYDVMLAKLKNLFPFFILAIIGAWFAQTKMVKTVKDSMGADYYDIAITDRRVIFIDTVGNAGTLRPKDITGAEHDWENGARVLCIRTRGDFDEMIVARQDLKEVMTILQARFI